MKAPAYIDPPAVIKMLGVSRTEFYRRRPALVKAGFPEKDPLVGKYLRADVEAWIQARRRVEPEPKVSGSAGINLAAC